MNEPMVEGQDFSGSMAPETAINAAIAADRRMEKIEPLEDSQAEIYERAFKWFQDARKNLQDLLVAGGFGDKDIVKAVFQGDNKHFVTKPSKNGDSI